jgi:hypothetical protein
LLCIEQQDYEKKNWLLFVEEHTQSLSCCFSCWVAYKYKRAKVQQTVH